MNIEVIQSAQPAQLIFPNATVTSSVTIEIQGNAGVTTLPFTSGTTAGQIREAVNAISDSTGVSASFVDPLDSTMGVVLSSAELGSRQFVSVQALSGTFDVEDATGEVVNRDEGRDATALINGALSLGDGNQLTLKTATLDVDLELDPSFGVGTTSFAITAGGALFQIGPEVTSNLQVNIGVQSVAASRLGNRRTGFLSQIQSGGDFSVVAGKTLEAQRIIDEAITQVVVQRGRLGAFEKNTLDTNVNQLSITMENLTAAESAIRDADFALETSNLTRAQILVSAGTSVLAIAQQTPQTVLSLLG